MASRTWLGSSEPDVQAEPDEAQMPLAVEQQEHGLALDALKAEVHIAGEPVDRVAVQGAVGNPGKSGNQLIPQGGDLCGVFVDMVAGLFQRGRPGP